MCYNVPFNHSLQRGMTSPIASLSRIMISLCTEYIWADVPWGKSCPSANWVTESRGGHWECQCTTQDTAMMSLRDRQTVAWVPIQLEQQGVPTSHPDPLLPLQTYTHPSPSVQYTHPAAISPLTPFPSPFSSFPRPTAPPDKQGTLIIPFPIINPCCFYTMGPQGVFQAAEETPSLIKAGHK